MKIYIGLLAVIFFFSGCVDDENNDRYENEISKNKITVGFSQPEINNPWRVYESLNVIEAAKKYGAELIYRDAGSDIGQQKRDVLYFIEKGVDYIILSPRVEEGFSEIFKKARIANIPVILIDRKAVGIPGVDYVTSITADFEEEGRKAAVMLANYFAGHRCNIVEIAGTSGATSTEGRSIGFREVIEDYPNMKIVISESGEYVRTVAQNTMEAIIQSGKYEIDAVFAHDDDSGIGAIQALKSAGMIPGKDVMVVSVAGQKDALKAIIAGELFASIECNPRLGDKAFDVIGELENFQTVPDEIIYTGKVYDKTNAEQLYHEAF